MAATLPNGLTRKQIPLYGGGLLVVRTRRQYQQCRHLLTGEDDALPGMDIAGHAECLVGKDGKTTYLVGWFDRDHKTLVHELAHTTFMVLKSVNVPLGADKESFCYLFEALFGLALEKPIGKPR